MSYATLNMNIQELSKTKAANWSNLNSQKFRLKNNCFIAEGRKCVADTFPHFNPVALIISDSFPLSDTDFRDIISTADKKNILFSASDKMISKISNLSTPSDIIAIYSLPTPTRTPIPIIDSPILLLDGIQDPGNMGTIIRTAHWFGLKHIFCSKNCVDIFNPKCVQSTMGSIAAVDIIYTDLDKIIDENPEREVCGLLLEGEDIFLSKLPENPFIIMGNEGKGISQHLRDKITSPLTIPPADPNSHPDSLNVAIATAITLAFFKK